jgi:hypothetical protein
MSVKSIERCQLTSVSPCFLLESDLRIYPCVVLLVAACSPSGSVDSGSSSRALRAVAPVSVGDCDASVSQPFVAGATPHVCTGEAWELPDYVGRSEVGAITQAGAVARDLTAYVEEHGGVPTDWEEASWLAPQWGTVMSLNGAWSTIASTEDGLFSNSVAGQLKKTEEAGCVQQCVADGNSFDDCQVNGSFAPYNDWIKESYAYSGPFEGQCLAPNSDWSYIISAGGSQHNGGWVPEHVMDAGEVDTLLPVLTKWCESDASCTVDPEGLRLDCDADAAGDDIIQGWSFTSKPWSITQLNNVYGFACLPDRSLADFTSKAFLEGEFEFRSELLDHMSTFIEPEQIQFMPLNAEGGELATWGKLGIDAHVDLKGWAHDLGDLGVNLAHEQGLSRDQMALFVQQHSIYDSLYAVAANEGFTVTTGSQVNAFRPSWLRRAGNVAYDQDARQLTLRGARPVGHVSIDLTKFHTSTDTLGEYRQFRLAALQSIALGLDDLKVQQFGLPSDGVYQDLYCPNAANENCNYNPDALDGHDTFGMYTWMSRSVGRPNTAPVEAFCAPAQYGDLTARRNNGTVSVDRVENPDDDTINIAIQGIGSGCRRLMTDRTGTPSRLLHDSALPSEDMPHPDVGTPWRQLGDQVFEATSVNPSSLGGPSGLYFDLDSSLVKRRSVADAVRVQVVFSVSPEPEVKRSNGQIATPSRPAATYTDMSIGWTDRSQEQTSPSVRIVADDTDTLYTVSFDVAQMYLDDRGAHDEDLAVHWDGGRAFDVVRVRVIPQSK